MRILSKVEEVELHVSEKEVNTLEKVDKSVNSSSSSSSSSRSSSLSTPVNKTSTQANKPKVKSEKAENLEVGEHVGNEIDPLRTLGFSTRTELMETFLQSLQDKQEDTLNLKVGGIKVETSKRADPSYVFALMLQPLSSLRLSSNVYFFDRDPEIRTNLR
ncbi:unnamed protein product [Mytilus coruscus]|uniref:Uncharacterized protein n=1 Tax=Mytilus coruscus TaxID=42192 RepID=A0A6J8EUG9_MYTCO|nr:unnamed protein product [Mytilus coruscus]